MAKLTSTDIYGSLYVQGVTALDSTLSATQFTSTIATGTAPLIVASTTLVTNLNADLLDGQQGTYYLDYNNFTNTPTSLKNPNALTIAGGLSLSSGTTYDGSAAVTLSHADTSSASSLTALTGANVVSDIDVDAYGHVTAMATRTMTLADLGYTGSPTADNYGSWTLQALNAAGTSLGSSAITSGDIAQFQAGTNVTLAWADDKITISSANTTYSAGTGLSLSGTTFNHSNAVTAGTASGSSGAVNFGGTVTIPSITYDAQGHITSKGSTTITLPTPDYTVDTDSYISSATFATDTGILSLTRTGDVTGTVTVDLDGRYLLADSFVNNYITGYTWNNGTTTGPTATITRNGLSNLSVSAFPSASATTSGVVTTGTQIFAGQKTFSNKVIFNDDIQVLGTVITNNVETVSTTNGIVFEGTVADEFEGTLLAGALTSDRTYTLPNASGTIALTGNIGNATITIAAGGGLTTGGAFTTNQSSNETITIDHADTSTQASVDNSGYTYIQDVTLDGYGHVTGLASATWTHPDTSTVGNLSSDNSGYTYIQDIAFTFDGAGHVTAASVGTATWTHPDTSTQASSNNSGRTYIQDVLLDDYGHVTGLTTATETVVDTNTLNTAGSTNSDSKLYLVGATSQTTSSVTYSDSEVYTTNGTLTTKEVQVGGTAATMKYDSTSKSVKFVFA
jgi:hypothetical protein